MGKLPTKPSKDLLYQEVNTFLHVGEGSDLQQINLEDTWPGIHANGVNRTSCHINTFWCLSVLPEEKAEAGKSQNQYTVAHSIGNNALIIPTYFTHTNIELGSSDIFRKRHLFSHPSLNHGMVFNHLAVTHVIYTTHPWSLFPQWEEFTAYRNVTRYHRY